MMEDFAVFILTHGRPDNVKTYETLMKLNYTGKVYIVIDNEDKRADEYYERFGDKVLMFDKLAISKTFDTGDNFTERRTVIYARNASFELAKKVGVRYFLELDDDYETFMFRYVKNNKLTSCECYQLDRLFESMIKFLNESNAMTVTFAQGGDFIGGKDNQATKKGLLRKAMNTFFCDVEKPFKFVGRINEDVNTYVTYGQRGKLLFTVTQAMICQTQTQASKGGMSDVYLDSGTYVKSFYTVMYSPSCVKISVMGAKNKRIHHRVNWNNAVPKILDEGCKK